MAKKTPAKAGTVKAAVKDDSYNEKFRNESTSSRSDFLGTLPTQMYINDPIARKIVDVVPEEMVTPGFGLDGIADEKAFRSLWDGMKLNEKLICALAWGRLFGGALCVAVVNDRRALTSPVGDGQLEQLRIYGRAKVRVGKREENPRNPRLGEPVTYIVTPKGGKDYEVHYTRCYPIDGERTTQERREQNDGWGETVLNARTIEAIEDFNYCHELATQLLRRKQQAVWKAKDLAMLCDDDDGRAAARLRLAQVDDNGGVGRAIGIDATDEDYQVLNSDIGGVDAFLDKKFDRIVAYSGIHEIILKNKNVGGVSSSQNTALETFYKLIDRKRNEDYRPLLEWLIPLIIKDEQWSIRFEPLSVPSEKDNAETFSKNSASIVALVEGQVIDAEEARDTLEAMSDSLKLKSRTPDAIKNPEPTEPEPGTTEVKPSNENQESE